MSGQATELSFKAIRDIVKAKGDGPLIDTFGKLAGLVLVLSPIALGPSALPALGLLGAKNELTTLGKEGLKRLQKESNAAKLSRYELLSSAYVLICYTAFFEAVDEVLPQIHRDFKLTGNERLIVTEAALLKLQTQVAEATQAGTDAAAYPIDLPHPTSTIEEDAANLSRLYNLMSHGFRRFVEGLRGWDEAEEHERDKISALISGLPDRARVLYRGQYLALCADYNEFCVWSNLHEHELTRAKLDSLSAEVKAVLRMRAQAETSIDLGLTQVENSLRELRAAVPRPAGSLILTDLAKTYSAAVEAPIIRDEYQADGGVDLRYPRKVDIFVPQAFRALRYSARLGPLEDEKAWRGTIVQEGIGPFLLSHFSSPYSTEAPLVALGHPGSGKSLLTEIVAARLEASDYTPIRVELRDINADSDITTQIEEQLRRDTGRFANWADVSLECVGRPPLVILDGYDELLQATGRVFSTYLMKVAAFQRREATLQRPVRVLVTSRITLIDKAEMPSGSTVIRLEDFNTARQERWTAFWNEYNALYFEARGLQPLALPNQPQVRALAQQPLLLLMLALYDSDSNQLAHEEGLDQTRLYDSLLRRFIARERSKGDAPVQPNSMPSHRAETSYSDEDMFRLGTAAVGMFNRRSLHVSKSDLDQDIAYFNAGRGVASAAGAVLGEAELLLGSFFFVHESRSRLSAAGDAEDGSRPSAFEFLHNTFGEFLTADFVLSIVLKECAAVRALRTNPELHHVLVRRLSDVDGLPQNWFASLMFTPMYTRPVILSMLREWGPHKIERARLDAAEFVTDLDDVIYAQFNRILSGEQYPSMMSARSSHPFPVRGVLEHSAIFTLNLVLIRAALTPGFTFDPDRISGDIAGHPWDRLTHLWRAALGMRGLEGFSRVVTSSRDERSVTVRLKSTFEAEATHALDTIYTTSAALGDDLLQGLAGWAMQDARPGAEPQLSSLAMLPAMQECGLDVEIHRRDFVRRSAEFGAAYGTSPARRPHSALTASLMAPGIIFPPDEEAGEVELWDGGSLDWLQRLPAEYGPRLWRRAWRPMHGEDDESLPEQSLRLFIRTRAWAAAEVVASSRGEVRTARQALDRRRRSFGRQVIASARRMLRAKDAGLPVEVALELIAITPVDRLTPGVLKVLEGCPPGAVATRSIVTIRRLLAMSEAVKQFGWADDCLTGLSRGTGQGPSLVLALGMAGTLALLESAAKRDVLDGHPGLNGIIDWMLVYSPVDEPLLSLTLLVSLLNRHHAWVSSGMERDVLLAKFGLQASEVPSMLGSQALADLDSLDYLYRVRRPKGES